MSTMKILSQSDVADFIGRICASAREVQSNIHVAAWNTLNHTKLHGDYSNALKLLNALPNGQRVKSLAFWFTKMSSGKFRPLQNGKTKAYECQKLGENRTDADFLMDQAEAISFADLTAEKDPAPLTLEKFIKGLKRTAENDGMFEGTDIPKVQPAARALALQVVQFIESTKVA